MERIHVTIAPVLIMGILTLASCQSPPSAGSAAEQALTDLDGACVLLDCSSGMMLRDIRPGASMRPLAPCSTFKIWNALIGLENGLLTTADQALYTWDGEERVIAAWNRDLTLREAFQVSCVPAFQALARDIGAERMQHWIDTLAYGDRNTSSGIDVFWLPAKDRRTLLISAIDQVQLISRLVNGRLPFSDSSLAVLKDLMVITETDKGTLYGKTGSGTDEHGAFVLGWFVGYVESGGNTVAFACNAQGPNVMSKNARAIVETVLKEQGLL